MANEQNLIPANKRSKSEARENSRKGGIKSGEVRREKRDLRERAKLLMEMAADPRVAAAMSKTGVEIYDNADVVMAGIMKGVLRGETKSINLLLELSGQNTRTDAQERRAKAEAERAELETELFKMRLDAIKGIGNDELPDDGFLDALRDKAAEDWSDDVL